MNPEVRSVECSCGVQLTGQTNTDTGIVTWQHGDSPEAKYTEPIAARGDMTWEAIIDQFDRFKGWLARTHEYEAVR